MTQGRLYYVLKFFILEERLKESYLSSGSQQCTEVLQLVTISYATLNPPQSTFSAHLDIPSFSRLPFFSSVRLCGGVWWSIKDWYSRLKLYFTQGKRIGRQRQIYTAVQLCIQREQHVKFFVSWSYQCKKTLKCPHRECQYSLEHAANRTNVFYSKCFRGMTSIKSFLTDIHVLHSNLLSILLHRTEYRHQKLNLRGFHYIYIYITSVCIQVCFYFCSQQSALPQ